MERTDMWALVLVVGHLLAVALTAGLAVFALRARRGSDVRWAFAAMAGAFSVWSLGSLLRSFTTEVGPYVAATTLKYVGVGGAPVAFLAVALAYAGDRPARRRRWLASLSLVPALTVAAVATTTLHGLFYTGFSVTSVGGVAMIETARGPWFWAFAVYGWGLLAVGSAVFLVNAVQRFSTFRVQGALVTLGIGLPWAASLAYILGGWPHPAVDPTPLGFAAGTGLFAAALFRVDRFELLTQGRGALFAQLDDPVFILDGEGRIVEGNPAGRELLGRLTGSPDAERLPASLALDGLSEGEVVALEAFGGSRAYRFEPVDLGSEDEGGTVAAFLDVTQERRAREEAEETLAIERTVLDATADGILVVGEDGRIVSHNQRFLELWNIPQRLVASGDDDELVAYVTDQLADPEAFRERVNELYENPAVEALDELELSDGRVIERYGKPWRRQGEIRGRAWSFRDVTEQRRAEQRFEEVLEAAPDALVLVDGEGAIQLVNEQAEEMFGYDRAELLGEPVERLVPGDLRGDHVRHREAYMADPEVRPMGVNLDLEAVDKDGSRFPVEISLAPIETAAGMQVLAAVRDVTERREIQRQVRRQAEELEEANRRLERANEDLRSFARILSHDLKEPLRIISSYVQLIERRMDVQDAELAEHLSYVKRASRRATGMIDGLRRFCRIDEDSGREPVDTGELLEEVTATLGMRIEETGANIDWGELPTVAANRAQIGQLFQNLVENAIKFRREDEPPRIEIEAEAGEADCTFRVRDNGRGIDPDRADDLFQMFDRGDAGESSEGQGVGLAICRKIVERHGGTIRAEPNEDAGSTFTFTLPRAGPRAASPASEQAAESGTENVQR